MTSSLLATLREGPHLGVLSICSLPTFFIALLCSAVALYLYLYPYTERTIAFRNLRGPVPVSPVFGSLLAINAAPVNDRYNALFREHGASTLRVRSLFGKWRIVTVDPVAITYILRHTGVWHRNSGFNGLIERMCGQTVLCVEDESHRRQRRILQAAFTPSCVNDMTPIFWAEVQALKDNLDAVGRVFMNGADRRLSPEEMGCRWTCCSSTRVRRSTLSAARASTTTLRGTGTRMAITRSRAPSTRCSTSSWRARCLP